MPKLTQNLLSQEFFPTTEGFSLNTIIYTLITLTVLLVASSHLVTNEIHNLREKADRIGKHEFSLAESKVDLNTPNSTNEVTTGPLAKIDKMIEFQKSRLTDIGAIFEKLETAEKNLLLELSTIPTTNVWVTRFDRTEERISIEGIALTPTAAPKWAANLKRKTAFSELEYQGINISQEGENRYKFKVGFKL